MSEATTRQVIQVAVLFEPTHYSKKMTTAIYSERTGRDIVTRLITSFMSGTYLKTEIDGKRKLEKGYTKEFSKMMRSLRS